VSGANDATDTGGKELKLGDLVENRRPGLASHTRLELENIMGFPTGRGLRMSTPATAKE
jgi:hypothetical protein